VLRVDEAYEHLAAGVAIVATRVDPAYGVDTDAPTRLRCPPS
jgi:hypothetical protein